MSTHKSRSLFECLGCSPAGCRGHTNSLSYQDTADTYSYYIDGEHQWTMGLDEMTELHAMIEDLDERTT